MTPEKLMKAGALAGVTIAIVGQLVPDLHTVPDLVITLAQSGGNVIVLPEGIAFPYWLAGVVGEPILIVSFLLVGLGFIGAWRKTREKTARIAGIVALIFSAERIFWAIADVSYATAVESVQATGDMTGLVFPGMLKGIAALFGGIIAVILASFIFVYFSRMGIKLGKVGGLLDVTAVATGIAAKTLTLWIWPHELTAVFVLLMVTKNVGIVFWSGALFQQAASKPEER